MSNRENASPDARTDFASWAAYTRDLIMDRTVVVSVSGGKDSTADALLFREAGVPFRAVHMDTGWEHPWTETYVRDYLPGVLGVPVEIVQCLWGGMADLCRHKGMFPSRVRRVCTQHLKVLPLIKFIGEIQAAGDLVLSAVGIRSRESKARSKLPEFEWHKDFDCEVWRPLIDWTEQDVIDLHNRLGVRPNPLYLAGATRVGCWPCIFCRKAELRMVADLTPERIDEIRSLEAEVQGAARLRYEARGETFESLGYEPPTWFPDLSKRTNKRLGIRASGHCPIDQAVAWSRTVKTKNQRELFENDHAMDGCMRWGLCEGHE